MKFMPIFTEPENCELWSTCYPEDQINEEIKDIYSILMDDKWSDDKYLLEFIKQNEECLNDNYWTGVDMLEIINNIKIEMASFDE